MRTIALLLAASCPVLAQPASEVLLHDDFEGASANWLAMSAGSTVRIDHGQAHSGSGALAFTYAVKPRQAAAAVMPARPELARLTRLRFWLKTDRATPIGVVLRERQPGGNYIAWVWSPDDAWHEITLTPADFILADGPTDPKDPDGKLDLDSLEGLGIFDVAGFFPALATAARSAPTHTFRIDDFEALAGPPTPSDGMRVDSFDRGFLSWIAINGAELELAPAGNPLGEPAMAASYKQTDEPFPSFVRRLGNLDLSHATRLEFDIASQQEATVNVTLEMNRPGAAQGPRFNLPIYPPENREVFHVSVKLADFQGQGKLDPAQLKTLILTDVSAAGAGDLGRNTLWIGNIEFR